MTNKKTKPTAKKSASMEKIYAQLDEMLWDKTDADRHSLHLTAYTGLRKMICHAAVIRHDGDNDVVFTKDRYVDPKEFKPGKLPKKVLELLERIRKAEEAQDFGEFFPCVITTGNGATFAEALDDLKDKMLLLDYGWSLDYTMGEYLDDNGIEY